MNIWEILQVMVLVPQWYLAAIGLASVFVSLIAFLIASWLSYRWALSRLRVKEEGRASGVEKRLQKSVRPVTVASAPASSPTYSNLSSSQEHLIKQRVEIGGGFLVADVAALLSVSQDDVVKKIKAKELIGYRDQSDRLWVNAKSLLDLVGPHQELPNAKEAEPKPASSPAHVPPVRQFYWYWLDGISERYTTLAAVLSALGYTGRAVEWSKLPPDVREKIHREKV